MTRLTDPYKQEADKSELDQLAQKCRDALRDGKTVNQAVSAAEL